MPLGHHAHQSEKHGPNDVGHAWQFNAELGKLVHGLRAREAAKGPKLCTAGYMVATWSRKRKTPLPIR